MGVFLAHAYEASFEERTSGLFGLLCNAAGLFSVYRLLEEKIYTVIPFAVAFFTSLNPDNYGVYWSEMEYNISTIGQGCIFAGTGFGVFALLLFLTTKSKNGTIKQINQYLESLKDKKKVKEHDQYIKDQKLLIEKRNELIRNYNANRVNDDIISSSALEEKKEELQKKKVDKSANPKNERKNLIKANAEAARAIRVKNVQKVVEKKYKLKLTNYATTWNKLFGITKSKPDHLVITGHEIETLIGGLCGKIVRGSPLNKIQFLDKNQGVYRNVGRGYETTHGRDRRHVLTSDYAQVVKESIIQAIEKGYITQDLVKVKEFYI